MNYFKDENGQVFAYDAEQVAMGYGSNLTPMVADEIDAHINPAPTPEQLAAAERVWRDAELDRSDIELNKVQDGRGVGAVGDWRTYRNALRDWPQSEAFPDETGRPVAPDAEEAE